MQRSKNFANPPRIDKVIAMVRVGPFFDSRVYMSYDVFPRKDVPFVGLLKITTHVGDKFPKTHKRAVNRHFQAKLANIKLAYY